MAFLDSLVTGIGSVFSFADDLWVSEDEKAENELTSQGYSTQVELSDNAVTIAGYDAQAQQTYITIALITGGVIVAIIVVIIIMKSK